MSGLWLILAFLAGCCVGISPWHWLSRKNEKLAREINAALLKGPSNG